jgi:transketolase
VAEQIAPRDTFGLTIAELGRTNTDIVVLDADLSPSTMVKHFAAAFPERFIEVGIAEANMIGIAAGLAASGKLPFASTFAAFASSRCFDQIRVSVAQSKLNVKIVATHAGVTVGEDGGSHQALEDLSLYCSLPNFTVIVPADSVETAGVIRAVADHIGPCYVRLPRVKLPVINRPDYEFKLGEAATLRDGKDVTIIAIGVLVTAALEAAASLAAEGIEARVLNMATVKPIDTGAILAAAGETGAIVTAEEHQKHGGLGSIVAEIVAEHRPVPVHFVAVNDVFGQSGKPDELLEHYGLTAADIVRAAKQAISRKG